jgi:protein-S-isoprenylcysteine O-methyltransferase Ste14
LPRTVYLWRGIYWLLLDATPLAVGAACGGRCSLTLPGPLRAGLAGVGGLLVVYGVILNVVAGRALRLHGHSGRVPRFTPPDRLVDVGVYSCMRHPAQLGLMLVGVGAGLLAGNPPALIASLAPVAGGLLFILVVEEPEARRLLGRAYHDYEERVPPFRLCLRGLRAPPPALGPQGPQGEGEGVVAQHDGEGPHQGGVGPVARGHGGAPAGG